MKKLIGILAALSISSWFFIRYYNHTYYSDEFTSKYNESIGAVGTYFNDSGIDYSFDIYVNGKLVHSQNGTSEFAGYKTIVLD